MTQPRLALEVAAWEFRRFFKLKDLLVTLVLFVVGTVGYSGVKLVMQRGEERTIRLAVVDQEPLQLRDSPSFEWVDPEGRDVEELRRAVGAEELDGLLVVHGADRAELLVAKEPFWRGELSEILDAARREVRIANAGLSPETLADVLAPFQLEVAYHEAAGKRSGAAEKIFAIGFVGLMLLGIFLGNAYLFVGITGEKQQRVTEQLVAIITPQTWIDGKILGLSLMSIVSVLNVVVGMAIAIQIRRWFGSDLTLPLTLIHPVLLLQLLALALLGFFFWFSFFAAIAATIDDPNTSARSAFLMLPIVPLAFAFGVLRDPDSLWTRVLGWIPGTSSTMMPARLVLTDVPWWEFTLSLALLVGATWILRRAAGKIFAAGVLMYGKEPGWREMWRWLKAA